ncbi:MAG TPA: FliM/FliN family flagellar motor switch protein [Oculatellaceae cyanobacterium]
METNQRNAVAELGAGAIQSVSMSPWQAAVRLASEATSKLNEVIQTFWGIPTSLKLLSVSLETHYYWRQDDFHVSQLVLGDATHSQEPANTALLRISSDTCAALLRRVLGERENSRKAFDFRQMSPLETTILNDFSRDLLACLMKNLLRKSNSSVSGPPLHFLWVLQVPSNEQSDAFEAGKIVLSIPPACLKPVKLDNTPAGEIPDDFFFHVPMEVRIRIGQTRLPLASLPDLEPGDWVVLEESDIQRMALIDPERGEALSFPVEIAQKQKFTVPYTQELATMETQQAEARQNLWDNLMIEVNAEFAPIKLPLKQLKQMTEGLVVEVGDLANSQIILQVEGKTLAQGELIIVGDKFGVRLTHVEGLEQPAPMAVAEASEAVEEPAANTEPDEADNEDDLDNFLNDSFDDEEEW